MRDFEMMQAYPFFSVVIPTYNRADFIETTLLTVLDQTYPHFEIIIVDNCSTDSTAAILEPYVNESKVRFIQHDRNYERAQSRNTGMSAARGDFVTLLDSDDFMYSNNLADAAEYVKEHPDVKCFHNLFEFVDGNRKVLYRYPMPDLKNQLRAITGANFMSCIGDFIHREIYQRYAFDTSPDLIGGEDWEYWLRVLADYKVGRIEKINNGVRQHSGRSVNTQNLDNMKRGLDQIYTKVSGDPHLAQVYAPYLKRLRANSSLYLAILANSDGLFKQARGYLFETIKADFHLLGSERFWRVARRAVLEMPQALSG